MSKTICQWINTADLRKCDRHLTHIRLKYYARNISFLFPFNGNAIIFRGKYYHSFPKHEGKNSKIFSKKTCTRWNTYWFCRTVTTYDACVIVISINNDNIRMLSFRASDKRVSHSLCCVLLLMKIPCGWCPLWCAASKDTVMQQSKINIKTQTIDLFRGVGSSAWFCLDEEINTIASGW